MVKSYKYYKRQILLFQESILSRDKFYAWRCDDLDLSPTTYNRSCPYQDEKEVVPMGEWIIDERPEGIFFLTTQDQIPYSCPPDEFGC